MNGAIFERMENQWLLILRGVQLGWRNQEAQFCHDDGQKVRIHAGEWNHILKDGKLMVIDTPWSATWEEESRS